MTGQLKKYIISIVLLYIGGIFFISGLRERSFLGAFVPAILYIIAILYFFSMKPKKITGTDGKDRTKYIPDNPVTNKQKVNFVLLFILVFGITAVVTGDQRAHTFKEYPLKLNLCELYPENAYIWKVTGIDIYPDIDSVSTKYNIPACDNIIVTVTDIDETDGQSSIKIRYGNIEGWTVKWILLGEK